jgi:plasmid stabilization system protein ParE
VSELPEPDGDPLARAWDEVLAAWGDDAAHERAIALADALDRLGELGARYRSVREAGGARAEGVERHQQQVLARALGRMARTPRQDASQKSRFEYVLYGVSATLLAAAVWSMLRSVGH